jgi:hypothetical protein
MNYHPDDFQSLTEEVEQQGGAHLNEICRPHVIRMNVPVNPEKPDGPKRSEKVETSGCRRRAKFLVPFLPDEYFEEIDLLDGASHGHYDDEGERHTRPAVAEDFDFESGTSALMEDGMPMLATICAVDDAMGLWPRFNASMHTGESFQTF